MMRARGPSVVVTFACAFACATALTEGACGGDDAKGGGEGEGDAAEGEGDEGEGGEGDGDEGEGEGNPSTVDVVFEQDGAPLPDFTLTLPEHDASTGPLDVSLAIHNRGDEPLAILTDPPLLIAGTDAALFSIELQPPSAIDAGESAPFVLRYAPRTAGSHQGKVLFAYGVQVDERVVLTVNASATGQGALPGVNYALYEGTFDVLPDFSTLTPVETGVIHNFDIGARVGADNFAFVFDGFLDVPGEGDFTFFLHSDDGSRLTIDGTVVADNDGLHGAADEVSGLITLTPGGHPIQLEYFEKGGAESVLVEWLGPGVPRASIPDDALFTSDP